MGGTSTVLTSPACRHNQEITLLHSRYKNSSGTDSKILCNDGAIELFGQSLGVRDNCFASQFQIKINDYSNFTESLVSCVYDDGVTANPVGNYSITLIGDTCIHHSLQNVVS